MNEGVDKKMAQSATNRLVLQLKPENFCLSSLALNSVWAFLFRPTK
jgi:hypothetical protein